MQDKIDPGVCSERQIWPLHVSHLELGADGRKEWVELDLIGGSFREVGVSPI